MLLATSVCFLVFLSFHFLSLFLSSLSPLLFPVSLSRLGTPRKVPSVVFRAREGKTRDWEKLSFSHIGLREKLARGRNMNEVT